MSASARAEPGLPTAWVVALILCPLAMLLIALFGFRELYKLWCTATGTQLRPNDPRVASMHGVHTGRYLKVWFESTVCDGLPVEFKPDEGSQMVEIGMDGRNAYRISNLSDQVVRMRPVHFISPIFASRVFGMKVCFCFNDQELQPHESRTFPIVYAFSPEIDPRIHTVNLCYTLFKLSDDESNDALNRRIERTVGARGGVVSPRIEPAAAPYAPPAAAPAPAPAPAGAP